MTPAAVSLKPWLIVLGVVASLLVALVLGLVGTLPAAFWFCSTEHPLPEWIDHPAPLFFGIVTFTFTPALFFFHHLLVKQSISGSWALVAFAGGVCLVTFLFLSSCGIMVSGI